METRIAIGTIIEGDEFHQDQKFITTGDYHIPEVGEYFIGKYLSPGKAVECNIKMDDYFYIVKPISEQPKVYHGCRCDNTQDNYYILIGERREVAKGDIFLSDNDFENGVALFSEDSFRFGMREILLEVQKEYFDEKKKVYVPTGEYRAPKIREYIYSEAYVKVIPIVIRYKDDEKRIIVVPKEVVTKNPDKHKLVIDTTTVFDPSTDTKIDPNADEVVLLKKSNQKQLFKGAGGDKTRGKFFIGTGKIDYPKVGEFHIHGYNKEVWCNYNIAPALSRKEEIAIEVQPTYEGKNKQGKSCIFVPTGEFRAPKIGEYFYSNLFKSIKLANVQFPEDCNRIIVDEEKIIDECIIHDNLYGDFVRINEFRVPKLGEYYEVPKAYIENSVFHRVPESVGDTTKYEILRERE